MYGYHKSTSFTNVRMYYFLKANENYLAGAQLAVAYPCNQDRLIQCAGSLRVLSDNQEFGFAAKKEDLDLICP